MTKIYPEYYLPPHLKYEVALLRTKLDACRFWSLVAKAILGLELLLNIWIAIDLSQTSQRGAMEILDGAIIMYAVMASPFLLILLLSYKVKRRVQPKLDALIAMPDVRYTPL